MTDTYSDTLAAIRFAVANISPERTDEENDAELRTIHRKLAPVADIFATFTNELDDGTGISNTTQDFIRAYFERLDTRHRQGMLVALAFALSDDDLEFIENLTRTVRQAVAEDRDGDDA